MLLRVEAGDGALFIFTESEEIHRIYVVCSILREWKRGYTWGQVVEVREGELGIKGSTMAIIGLVVKLSILVGCVVLLCHRKYD